MQADQYSRTALAAAFYRAQHYLHDEPKLLVDPYAHRLLTAGEMTAFADVTVQQGIELGIPVGDPSTVLAQTLRQVTAASHALVRARYTEDRLDLAIARGIGQYVLVGAGLDTFAFRRPELRDRIQVFELDHPQTQAFKRERLAAAGLVDPPNLKFATVDFEFESVADALRRSAFRADRAAFFAWLGVTPYLTRSAIDATWQSMRSVGGPGSELVFDYLHADAFSEAAPPPVRLMLERTRAVGEPMITGFDPTTLEAKLAATGWALIEQLDFGEIDRRYFATRSDGYHARPLGHLACAGVF